MISFFKKPPADRAQAQLVRFAELLSDLRLKKAVVIGLIARHDAELAVFESANPNTPAPAELTFAALIGRGHLEAVDAEIKAAEEQMVDLRRALATAGTVQKRNTRRGK